MKIGEKCSVVMACRVSPKQKQEVVSLVRTEVIEKKYLFSYFYFKIYKIYL